MFSRVVAIFEGWFFNSNSGPSTLEACEMSAWFNQKGLAIAPVEAHAHTSGHMGHEIHI